MEKAVEIGVSRARVELVGQLREVHAALHKSLHESITQELDSAVDEAASRAAETKLGAHAAELGLKLRRNQVEEGTAMKEEIWQAVLGQLQQAHQEWLDEVGAHLNTEGQTMRQQVAAEIEQAEGRVGMRVWSSGRCLCCSSGASCCS